MPYSTDVLTSVEIGPGKYMGQDSLGQRGSPFNPNAKRNTYNGSSAERFSDKRQLKNPGPGSYKINADSLLEKSVFTFSKRFSPSAANIYVWNKVWFKVNYNDHPCAKGGVPSLSSTNANQLFQTHLTEQLHFRLSTVYYLFLWCVL